MYSNRSLLLLKVLTKPKDEVNDIDETVADESTPSITASSEVRNKQRAAEEKPFGEEGVVEKGRSRFRES